MSELDLAFESAIEVVDRALAADLRTASGESARPRLERLRADLEDRRAEARRRGSVDAEWVRRVVRDVADWTPATELLLLAALGRIARSGGVRGSSSLDPGASGAADG